MKRYPNCDWLRLYLALSVLIWHVVDPKGYLCLLPIPLVPGFLALSGFLVLQSWERSNDIWHFWKKRILRIFPGLAASMLLVYVLHGYQPLVDSVKAYFSLGEHHGVWGHNGPIWTLLWEEILYFAILPISLIGAYKNRKWILWFLAVGLLATSHLIRNDDSRIMQALGSLPVAFILGNLAYVYRELLGRWAGKWGIHFVLVVLSVRVIEQVVFGGMNWDSGYDYGNPILWALSLCAVLAIALNKTGPSKLKIDLSYGCYIYHLPIIVTLQKSGLQGIQLIAASLLLTLVLSYASWKLIESPSLALKDKVLIRFPKRDAQKGIVESALECPVPEGAPNV